ncbi:Thiosulfate sulfurtransferase, rhodanese [hydrothermal vent metagenome]|uniref:Thiosulfate sulfurtransferase, rhodanese n=1 Tax=hydrothermal vent metagenome TaxID=652676 RepID=A0A1W1C829_9ZZZZ
MATVELTETNFNETVEKNDIIIIDFWAPWCGPCKSFGPVYEKVSDEYPEIVFGKVNTEEQQALAGHFQIRSIPTTFILKENIVVFQQAGVIPEEGLKDIIKQVQELDMDMVRQEIQKQEK